jgi:hypothetical protein
MNKLPIYKMTIDETDENSGVDFVALVDNPAIEIDWFKFSKDDGYAQFKSVEPDRRIITGALMVADTPIYRKSEKMGEFMVVFDKSTIEKIVQKFFKNKNTSNVNEMHETSIEDVFMFESFITDKQRGILAPKGFKNIPDGSWFGSYKVDNEEVWNEFIKTGQFKGFSVEGVFGLEPMKMATHVESNKFSDWLDATF